MRKNNNTKSHLTIRSDASREKASHTAHPNTIKRVTMSSQIDCNEIKEAEKLSLVHKHITVLDAIAARFGNGDPTVGHRIKILYLSNNFISNIEHIQQFPNL